MKSQANFLVVDDERSWRDFYEAEIRQMNVGPVWSAGDLAEAGKAIESVRFAVALVDIGLEEDDDRNVDGLRVMQLIRGAGDPTSIIVVTGRSGRDVLSIVRDSIKEYDALDAVAKKTLAPSHLRHLLESGIRAYQDATSDERRLLYDSLRGEAEQVIWDDAIMRATGIHGGAKAYYSLLESLFRPFVPLVSRQSDGVQVHDGVAYGTFWSRGTGHAVMGCFGEEERVETVMEQARGGGMLLGGHAVKELVNVYRGEGNGGVVYLLANCVRGEFG